MYLFAATNFFTFINVWFTSYADKNYWSFHLRQKILNHYVRLFTMIAWWHWTMLYNNNCYIYSHLVTYTYCNYIYYATCQLSITRTHTSWHTDDFQNVRNFIKNKLQSALSGSGLLPPTSQINIFGSSQNNFGSENADCDMCISYPGCEEVNREDKVSTLDFFSNQFSNFFFRWHTVFLNYRACWFGA